jgi:hypothetical protein
MILDALGHPRYFDKPISYRIKPVSLELKALYKEIELNPKFHIRRENNFYPRGFPSMSIGW